jgi:hypothetical protein
MKWKSATLCAVVMFGISTVGLAQQPTLPSRQSVPAAAQLRRPIFSQISWWAKYGQPVEPAPGAVEAAPAAEAPLMYDHGYGFGYVYGLGSCDCRPPCISQLWDGYVQNPHRCSHPQYHDKNGNCSSCGSCGNGGYGGHGGYGGCAACGPVGDCGCTAATPSCAADSCTSPVCCKSKCKCSKQWFAHWHWGKKCCDTCNSCSEPVGCSCAAPIGGPGPAADVPAVSPPLPAADEASVLKMPLLRRVSNQQLSTRTKPAY